MIVINKNNTVINENDIRISLEIRGVEGEASDKGLLWFFVGEQGGRIVTRGKAK